MAATAQIRVTPEQVARRLKEAGFTRFNNRTDASGFYIEPEVINNVDSQMRTGRVLVCRFGKDESEGERERLLAEMERVLRRHWRVRRESNFWILTVQVRSE